MVGGLSGVVVLAIIVAMVIIFALSRARRSNLEGTVDPHISEGNGTDPTSYMLKIRI